MVLTRSESPAISWDSLTIVCDVVAPMNSATQDGPLDSFISPSIISYAVPVRDPLSMMPKDLFPLLLPWHGIHFPMSTSQIFALTRMLGLEVLPLKLVDLCIFLNVSFSPCRLAALVGPHSCCTTDGLLLRAEAEE